MPVPNYLERLLRLVLPPACREHVLGDLQERYRSPGSYLADAISVLGPVIIGRIRRTTDLQVFVMESLGVYLSFVSAAWCLGQEGFLHAQAGFARLAVPTGVAAVGLLFSNAYSALERASWWRPILHSVGSLSLALLGQAVVFDWQPGLAVPFRTILYGGALAVIVVSPLRAFFPPVENRPSLARPGANSRAKDHLRSVRIPVRAIDQLRRHVERARPAPQFHAALALLAICSAAAFLLSPMWHKAFEGPRLIVLALAVVAGWRITNRD